MTLRLAVVVSHPIQHFCPQYSSWAKMDVAESRVFFASRHGLDAYADKNFARTVKWEDLRLDFPHEFLPGAVSRQVNSSIDCEGVELQLGAFSPDVLIVYGYAQPLQRRVIAWAKRNKKSVIMIADSELRAPRNALKRLAKKLLLPLVFKDIDVFLTVGDANEQYYRAYGVDDRRLIRCSFPIDIASYDMMMDRRDVIRHELRRQLGIPLNHKVLLMVGKLVRWKRQKDIIQFSNMIQEARRDITVIIAGTGPDEKDLRTGAKNVGSGGVFFAGFVPPSQLVEYYFAADIYVHCSSVEPHSLAISEAIYSSLPVVLSSNCGSYGPTDDVRQGLNGFVYECGNTDELYSTLLGTLDNQPLMRSMAKQSRSIALANQTLAHGEALTQALEVINLKGKY